MDSNINDCIEPSVDEGAFWHTNMDLYYGYLPGEVVEVEHEPNKYWLALIQYCFKHLVLLKWIGNYGSEFWVDTSTTNSATCSSGTSNEFSNPKRLFPLGYHLQSQLKSQFTLEKPSRILVKPSLYNPLKDPYADIKTIDDLLVHEIDDHNNDDVFETASLAMAKYKSKINYCQEDQDELEAALQALSGIEDCSESDDDREQQQQDNNLDESTILKESTPKSNSDTNGQANTDSKSATGLDTNPNEAISSVASSETNNEISKHDKSDKNDIIANKQPKPELAGETDDSLSLRKKQEDDIEFDANRLELCKKLQASAINKGRYLGVHPTSNELNDKVFFSKPKQFFDVGGANHERLFVPGTLLEVCHIEENKSGQLDLLQWFAFVVKNVGGRLILRWLLCDEPKFKQGRLELKSSRSRFVIEESDQPIEGDTSSDVDSNKIVDNLDSTPSTAKQNGISSKSITFAMHFCDPKIHTISHAKTIEREYKLPSNISAHIQDTYSQELLIHVEECQLEHVFDTRRMNLDRDRPLIDHILAAVRFNAPNYLDLIFAPKDEGNKREVLLSCPKITKLLKASVVRELGPGIFEIHSEPLSESEEVIKIIYPFENSFAILPLDWANNHEDCLSINPSRNPSPTVLSENSDELASKRGKQDQKVGSDTDMQKELPDGPKELHVTDTVSDNDKTDGSKKGSDLMTTNEQCLKDSRARYARFGGSFKKVTGSNQFSSTEIEEISDFDELDPTCWTRVLRNRELKAESFHCCIDYSQKTAIESRFKVMDQLEVVHPSSDSIICMGRIRKVVFPLIWIQLSSDCYTVVPFNSTNIYPAKWCETHNHKLISLLPPRKRCIPKTSAQQSSDMKRRKKAKTSTNDSNLTDSKSQKLVSFNLNEFYEKEHFDLGALNDRQAGIDYILNEKSAYIKIFFNHKCFTGPSLSKSKICSLPQYVGPGPMRLVIEEVVTKVISVAYVPPRILNDLSSKSFEELLVERNLTNVVPIEFKAKYQKRVHRDTIPVCVNPDDAALYCECICEHIKCCYNLFGLNLYDGDDCPSHCRSLTKSNKFMKRATYYREKARQGEFLSQNNNDNNSNKKVSNSTSADNNSGPVTASRARYTGRGSSESTSSSNLSCSDQTNSRASPSSGRATATICEMKENSVSPDAWTIEDVARYLDGCQLSIFKSYMKSEGIDGQALLLLDKATIEEHFQQQMKSEITQEEVNKLCQIVEMIKARM